VSTGLASSLRPLGGFTPSCRSVRPAGTACARTRFHRPHWVRPSCQQKTAYTVVLVVVVEIRTGLFGADDPVDGSDPSGNDDISIGDSLDSMSMAVYSSVFQSSLNTLESVGVVSAATAPYPVLVVTMGSKQYMPETTVKDDAQAAIVPGAIKGVTKIYIAVPPTANPQAMVNYWSNHSFWDNEFAFRDYFKIGGAHDYKNDKQFADRAIFDAFGNFNYGACGEAAGVPRWLLQHEANKGKPGGNNPINTADINSGFDAIEKGGTLSTKMENLVPPSSSP
jgi:hypothetical protein